MLFECILPVRLLYLGRVCFPVPFSASVSLCVFCVCVCVLLQLCMFCVCVFVHRAVYLCLVNLGTCVHYRRTARILYDFPLQQSKIGCPVLNESGLQRHEHNGLEL